MHRAFPRRHSPNTPVYQGVPESRVSYSGQDVRATAYVNRTMYELGSLNTVSISTFRDIVPVRGCGRASAQAHGRGYRTTAGTFVFTQFNKDAWFDMISYQAHDRAAGGSYPTMPDQIPPFNVILHFGTEVERSIYAPVYRDANGNNTLSQGSKFKIQSPWNKEGKKLRSPFLFEPVTSAGSLDTGYLRDVAKVRTDPVPVGSVQILYKVTLQGGGSTMGIDDLITEAVYNWVALAASPLRDRLDINIAGYLPEGSSDWQTMIQNGKTAPFYFPEKKKVPLKDRIGVALGSLAQAGFGIGLAAIDENNRQEPEIPDEDPVAAYAAGATASETTTLQTQLHDARQEVLRIEQQLAALTSENAVPLEGDEEIALGPVDDEDLELASSTLTDSGQAQGIVASAKNWLDGTEYQSSELIEIPNASMPEIQLVAVRIDRPKSEVVPEISSRYGSPITQDQDTFLIPPAVAELTVINTDRGQAYNLYAVRRTMSNAI